MERLLVYGPQGSGKTHQLLNIAKWLQPTGAQFYVLDTDDSYSRNMEVEDFSALDNVHTTFAYDWEQYISWLDDVLPKVVAERDWLVVDRVDKAWDRVQNFFSEEVYGKSLAERLTQSRKAMSAKKAMVVSANDQADWQTINANYQGWFMATMYKSRCNIYLVAAERSVRDQDSEETKDSFGPLHGKPAGQKTLAYEPHTVLRFYQDRKGAFFVTTAKDRGNRGYFDSVPLTNLALQYLFAKANFTRSRK